MVGVPSVDGWLVVLLPAAPLDRPLVAPVDRTDAPSKLDRACCTAAGLARPSVTTRTVWFESMAA